MDGILADAGGGSTTSCSPYGVCPPLQQQQQHQQQRKKQQRVRSRTWQLDEPGRQLGNGGSAAPAAPAPPASLPAAPAAPAAGGGRDDTIVQPAAPRTCRAKNLTRSRTAGIGCSTPRPSKVRKPGVVTTIDTDDDEGVIACARIPEGHVSPSLNESIIGGAMMCNTSLANATLSVPCLGLGSGWTGSLSVERVPGGVNSRGAGPSTGAVRAATGLSEAGGARRLAMLERIRAKSASERSASLR